MIINYLKKNVSEILIILVFTYFSFAYLPFAFSNITIILLTVFFIIYGLLNKEKVFKREHLFTYLLFSIPILTVFSFVVNTQDHNRLLSELLQKLPTIIIPVVVLYSLYNKKQLKKAAGFFVLFSLFFVFVALFKLLGLYLTDVQFDRYTFQNATVIQHLYFGIYQIVALLFLVEFYSDSLNKYLFYFAISLLSIGVFISTSRISYILFALIVSLYVFRLFPVRKAVLSMFILIGISVSMIFTIPQLKQKFNQSFNTKTSPRLIIWKNSYLFLKNSDNPILGVGLDYYKNGSTGTYWLKGMAKQKSYKGIEGFNSHNQFFEFILLGGVFGLLFVFFMFYTLYRTILTKDIFIISLILLLILFSSVENILDRQWGVILYSVLIGIIYSRLNTDQKEWLKD